VEKIKLKIRAFDEISNSLIVAFGCDDTHDSALDTCNALAYQPTMFPDVNDPEEVLRRIAFSGISLVEQQKVIEAFAADTNKLNAYKSLVGQSFEFSVSELLTPTIVDDANE
jgi:hypothetical protein